MDATVKGFLRIISAERVKERLLVRRKARLQPAPWQKSNDPSAGAAAPSSERVSLWQSAWLGLA